MSGRIGSQGNTWVEMSTEQCSDAWKAIKAEIHSHELQADTELVKQALLASGPFEDINGFSFLSGITWFLNNGTPSSFTPSTLETVKTSLQTMSIMYPNTQLQKIFQDPEIKNAVKEKYKEKILREADNVILDPQQDESSKATARFLKATVV